MDAYSRLIRSARESIDSYFSSCSLSPEKLPRPPSAVKSAFEAAESIYSSEDSIAMQQLKLIGKEEKPQQQRFVRERRSYEKEYWDRKGNGKGTNSYSPRKPVLAIASLSRQSTKVLSPSPKPPVVRTSSLRSRRSSRLHSLMSVCTQAKLRKEVPAAPMREEERKEKRCMSHVSIVAKTIQQVDAPSELLEPMYYLRRQSDLSLHKDAVRMKLEEQNSANTSSGQIRLMIVRNAVHRRNSRPRT